ncbi:alginate lyase family protein [Sphingomonas sp. HITSZ_GF]|uniref:alginate lyase family protein n=1 Tax=Sphingomonas sp. HITSZ_GF TaxID=3037247 RepID=UPI00240DB2E1|nr:alginate lyase family protein [Sphingomonas sp. HITSZ_GF]MDG2535565.1 alginate lyase family protein [Sphingomonas sp. HITSZ_GF]
MKLLLCSAAALFAFGAVPASAQDQAILGPGFAREVPRTDPVARRVIARADAALARAPGAIPELHTEGTLPGKGIREISLKAKEDQGIVIALALAWRLTGDRRYLDQTARYLENWADVYHMSFNPIDETGFDTLILATDLTEADLAPALKAKLDGFWRRMASGYLDAMDGTPKNAHTNWQSHRIKLATMAAFEVGDVRLIDRARAAFRKQVAGNIRPDGSVFDFYERDALHYVTYNLDPMLMAVMAAQAHDQDWYGWKSPTGSSLAGALKWLEPYAAGEKTHVEFANSQIAFDRERAQAGQKEYAPHPWDPGNAVNTYALASLINADYRDFAAKLAARTGRKPADWAALLAR